MSAIVLVLYTGGIDKDHLRSMQGLQALGIPSCAMNDHPLVDQARSYLTSFVLVWIDDDIIARMLSP